MKPFLTLPTVLLLSLTGLTASLPAQEKPLPTPPAAPAPGPSTTVTEERTTTAALPDPDLDKIEGKIQRMDPEKNQLMLRTKHGKEPIPYNVNAATKIIDLDGKPVAPALLIAEVPVEVRYVQDGSELIASSVVVQRYQAPLPGGGVTLTSRETLKAGGKVIEETVKTTTVTRSGTVRTMEPGFLTVVTEGEAQPVRYQYSATTAWVNAKGEPVPVAVLKPGYSVRVKFSKNADGFMADQVIVTMPSAAPLPVPVPAPQDPRAK